MRIGTHPMPRNLRIALLVVSAALLTVLLSQCRMVEDRLTSPQVGLALEHPDNHGNCISQCAHAYADSIQTETALHVSILHACGDDQTCVDNENARFAAVQARIAQGRIACFDGCHHQGGGAGGR